MPILQFSQIVKFFPVENVKVATLIEEGENALKSDHTLRLEVNKQGHMNSWMKLDETIIQP